MIRRICIGEVFGLLLYVDVGAHGKMTQLRSTVGCVEAQF